MRQGVDDVDQRFGALSGDRQREPDEQGNEHYFENISLGEGVKDRRWDDVH